MALPAFPFNPLVSILGVGGTDAIVPEPKRTTFDDGPDRVRRRRLLAATRRPYVLVLTHAQFVTFKNFVDVTLNGGVGRFTASVRGPAGTLVTKTCRFVGPISEDDRGSKRRVSFTLEIFGW